MFELSVEAEFCAAHAIVISGVREAVHGHNWRITAVVAGPRLDQDGLLCDFHAVEAALAEVIRPFHNADLNTAAPFTDINPSAEHVARHIGVSLKSRLAGRLPEGAFVKSVRVTEAPGCAATWFDSSSK